jgi:hypothetical protein
MGMIKKDCRVKLEREQVAILHEVVSVLPQLFVPDGWHQELLVDHMEELAYVLNIKKAVGAKKTVIHFKKTGGRAFFQYFTQIADMVGLPDYTGLIIQNIIDDLDKEFGFARAEKLIGNG